MPNYPRVYWRRPSRSSGGTFHCFVKINERKYESLCGRWKSKHLFGGGAIRHRPHSMLRCAQCDIGEMRVFKVEESLPHDVVS